MIVVNIDPIALSIGPLAIHWYGLMYVVGIAVGLLIAWPYAKSKGFTQSQMETVVYWAILAGLIGARLYYVVQQPLGPYLAEPWRILAFWEGGMAFYGAIFAVVIVLLIACWRMKMSILKLLDIMALFAPVGQFFGRIGNFINGDVIGYPTSLPWGVVYANPDSFPPRHDIAYHPAAAYEALTNVILFAILWSLRNRLKPGMLFFVYILGYSLSQIIVFTWRDNEVIFLGLKQAQLTAIAVIIVAVTIYVVILARQNKSAS
ncbi:MAG: prolipoprotein diacylglyceryl transferase, partial [Dehalococcoidia bacterium]